MPLLLCFIHIQNVVPHFSETWKIKQELTWGFIGRARRLYSTVNVQVYCTFDAGYNTSRMKCPFVPEHDLSVSSIKSLLLETVHALFVGMCVGVCVWVCVSVYVNMCRKLYPDFGGK